MTDQAQAPFACWAIVELLGHRRLGAYVTEATIAGAGFLRLDVPGATADDPPLVTQFVQPGSVYCLTPATEATVRAMAQHHQPQPVQQYELLPPAQPRTVRRFEEPDSAASTAAAAEEEYWHDAVSGDDDEEA